MCVPLNLVIWSSINLLAPVASNNVPILTNTPPDLRIVAPRSNKFPVSVNPPNKVVLIFPRIPFGLSLIPRPKISSSLVIALSILLRDAILNLLQLSSIPLTRPRTILLNRTVPIVNIVLPLCNNVEASPNVSDITPIPWLNNPPSECLLFLNPRPRQSSSLDTA